MSHILKTTLAFGLIAFVAACAQQEEVIIVEPEPIVMEEPMSKF